MASQTSKRSCAPMSYRVLFRSSRSVMVFSAVIIVSYTKILGLNPVKSGRFESRLSVTFLRGTCCTSSLAGSRGLIRLNCRQIVAAAADLSAEAAAVQPESSPSAHGHGRSMGRRQGLGDAFIGAVVDGQSVLQKRLILRHTTTRRGIQ